MDFPIVNKQIIRESSVHFALHHLRKQICLLQLQVVQPAPRLKFYHDKGKKLRNYSDTLYFAGLAGYRPGQRLIYLKIWAKKKMKNPVVYLSQNIVPIDVIHFNDGEIEELISKMECDRSTFSILGYASALELICRYLDRTGHGPVNADVRSVIAMSEALNDYTRQSFEEIFWRTGRVTLFKPGKRHHSTADAGQFRKIPCEHSKLSCGDIENGFG